MNWRIIFTKWWGRQGRNADLVDLEDAFRAGWLAALKSRR
jgi:hypothetical protein